MAQEQTHGEKLVEQLLNKLDEKRFFYISEYRISDSKQDLYPDFILVIRDLGVIVIEVKDYVEILNGSTQKQLKIRQRNGQELSIENPAEQARQYAQKLSNQLKERTELLRKNRNETDKKQLLFRWQPVVIYANLSRSIVNQLIDHNIAPSSTTWCRDDLLSAETLIQAIERTMSGQRPIRLQIMQEVFNNLRGALNPPLIIKNQEGQDIGTLSLLQEYLTFEALKLSEDTSIRLVRGVAGSGKSLVLMRRAQYLSERHPNARMLIMTFNVDLADNMREKLGYMGLYDVEVTNFHKQCVKIFKDIGYQWREPIKRIGWLEQYQASRIQQAGLTVEFVDDELKWRKEVPHENDDEYLTNQEYLSIERKGRGGGLIRAKREIINAIYSDYEKYQSLLRGKGQAWLDWEDVGTMTSQFLEGDNCKFKACYDIIMIDEAQDFAPIWLNVAKKMLKPNGSLFLYDDPTQSLFREFSWKEKGVDVTGRTRILQIPFRNTRQIAQAAHALIHADPLISTSDIPVVRLQAAELREGETPVLQRFKSQEEEIREVRKKALSFYEESPSKKVAILCHNKRDVNNWAELRDRGIYVDSFARMKGLEFDSVIIPFLCSSFAKRDGGEKDAEFVAKKRREVFTAMTRPRFKLFLSYHNAFASELEPIEAHIYHEQ